MRLDAEKVSVILVVACVVLTLLGVLVFRTHRLSQAEAIEIGMKSRAVQHNIDRPATIIKVWVNYISGADVSTNREVWYVWWLISYVIGGGETSIQQYIDPETGVILGEYVAGF